MNLSIYPERCCHDVFLFTFALSSARMESGIGASERRIVRCDEYLKEAIWNLR